MHLPSLLLALLLALYTLLLPALLLTLSTLLLPAHANSYNETRCFCGTQPSLGHPRMGALLHHSYHSDRLDKTYTWNSLNTYEIKRAKFTLFHECRFENCLAFYDDCAPGSEPKVCSWDGVPTVGKKSHRKEIRWRRIQRKMIAWERMPDEVCDKLCRERFDPWLQGDGITRYWQHWCNAELEWNRCGEMRVWGLKDL